MDNYEKITQNELAQQIKKETRMSLRQVALIRWVDINDDRTIRTWAGREAQISEATYWQLMRLPVRSGFVFSTSPLPPENLPTPTRREYGAHKRMARKDRKKHFSIKISIN